MPFFPRSRSRNDRGRRREDDSMQAVEFELDALEFVEASEDVGLLRVAGRWTAPVSRALQDIVLSIARGPETLELTPLPDLNGVAPVASPAGEEWRGAFTMAVEVADDPRSELVLVAGDDARVALPRPGEWEPVDEEAARSEAEETEPPLEPGSASPVVGELFARLEEVARLEEEPEDHWAEQEPEEDEHAPELEPASPEATPPPAAAELVEPAPDVHGVEPLEDTHVAGLEAELELLRVQLQEAGAELELERRRRAALEEELRGRRSVEDDLRNAIAMQEAELASATAQAQQDARRAERRRHAPEPASHDHLERSRSKPADEEFLTRLERATRAGEAAV